MQEPPFKPPLMEDAPPVEVHPGIWRVSLLTRTLPPANHTACFVVGRDPAVVVDPGSALAEQQEALEALLRDLGARVRCIVLTHHHPDHIGGAAALQRTTGAPIGAHRFTHERLDFPLLGLILRGGDIIPTSIGDLSLLHTPGHAPGHLALHLMDGPLLVGDLLAGIGTILLDPSEGNLGQYLDSLRRIARLGSIPGLPAHGPTLPDLGHAARTVIAHRLARSRQIRTLLRIHPSGMRPADLAREIYAGLADVDPSLAVRQVETHLLHELTLGAITKEGDTYRAVRSGRSRSKPRTPPT